MDTKQTLKSRLLSYSNLARYRFTTAREVELGSVVCPERNALIDDDGVLTYQQLRDQSRTVAKWLLNLQHDRGLDTLRIAVMTRNGCGMIIPLAAKGYTGGEIFLINAGSSRDQIAGIIAVSNINVLFIDDEFADRLSDALGNVTVIWAHTSQPHGDDLNIDRIIFGGDKGMPKLPVFPHHGNIVIMSSGTTGIPKGVKRAEPILPFVIAGYLSAIPLAAGQTVHASAAMFHSWGWSAVNLALAARNTVVMTRVFDPEKVLKQIQDYRCDGVFSSPILLKQMLEVDGQEKYDTSRLSYIASAGNVLTPHLAERVIERFGPILANIYGSTELALAASADPELIAKAPPLRGASPQEPSCAFTTTPATKCARARWGASSSPTKPR